ncbi:MAG: hypothetical protein Q9209_000867 [Squamulea sp. 1 TL-2023]
MATRDKDSRPRSHGQTRYFQNVSELEDLRQKSIHMYRRHNQVKDNSLAEEFYSKCKILAILMESKLSIDHSLDVGKEHQELLDQPFHVETFQRHMKRIRSLIAFLQMKQEAEERRNGVPPGLASDMAVSPDCRVPPKYSWTPYEPKQPSPVSQASQPNVSLQEHDTELRVIKPMTPAVRHARTILAPAAAPPVLYAEPMGKILPKGCEAAGRSVSGPLISLLDSTRRIHCDSIKRTTLTKPENHARPIQNLSGSIKQLSEKSFEHFQHQQLDIVDPEFGKFCKRESGSLNDLAKEQDGWNVVEATQDGYDAVETEPGYLQRLDEDSDHDNGREGGDWDLCE